MASSCNINGIIGLRNGRAFQYAAGKQFWKHDGFLPLRNDTGCTEIDTFIMRCHFLIGLQNGRAFQYAAGKQFWKYDGFLPLRNDTGCTEIDTFIKRCHFPDDPNPQTHCIPCTSFNFSPPGSDWTVARKQFPLRLAYATTFNGCQGLTLDRSVLDLRINPFAHGQLYTALSPSPIANS